jgi:hypothetical protein
MSSINQENSKLPGDASVSQSLNGVQINEDENGIHLSQSDYISKNEIFPGKDSIQPNPRGDETTDKFMSVDTLLNQIIKPNYSSSETANSQSK